MHVRDYAHPASAEQRADVMQVLGELGLEDRLQTGVVEVLNKLDLLDPRQRACLEQGDGEGSATRVNGHPSVAASALTGIGIDLVLEAIDARLTGARRIVEVRVPYADGATLAWLYRHGEVLGSCRRWRQGASAGRPFPGGCGPAGALPRHLDRSLLRDRLEDPHDLLRPAVDSSLPYPY